MNKLPQSATYTDAHGNRVEDIMFTYSEEEKQQNEVSRANSDLVFSPKFIPFYPAIQKEFALTDTETKIFGFIEFFMSNNKGGRFYFTNEQIGLAVNCNPDTVSRSIARLETLDLIVTSKKVRSGGGLIRFVENVNSKLTNYQFANRQKLQTNNNKINNNKINNNRFINKSIVDLTADLFDFYLKTTGSKEKLTPKRKSHINARLKEFTPDQIKRAIENAWSSPFYRGKNDRGWKLNADYMFRSYEIIERFTASNTPAPMTREEAEKIDDPVLRYSILQNL